MKTLFCPVSVRRLAVALASVLPSLLTGCGNDAEVRVYQEVRVAPDAPANPAAPHGTTPRPRPTAPAQSASLRWQTPEGWTESPGSGMRLASFAMGEQGDGQCTIVTLSGSAGGLQANVARWIGQLNLTVPADEAFSTFLEAQDRFETKSGHPVVLVDLTPLTREQGAGPDSMIVAVATIGSRTGFIKLTGPMPLLEKEKDNLRALCRSLQTPS